ncbi:MAG: thermonuclease family protein [Gemmatimonadota bacterium]
MSARAPVAPLGRVRQFVVASFLLAVASGLAAGKGFAQGNPDTETFSCTVAFVIDGDSFNCRSGIKVRLLLVNAPEDGPFGDLARGALAGLLPAGERFRIETDRRRQDKQGRVMGYVFLPDGQMVNEMMIRQGYAFLKPDETNQRYLTELREAEAAARETERGLWAR